MAEIGYIVGAKTNKMKNLISIPVAILILILSVAIIGCNKTSSSAANEAFVGSYYGSINGTRTYGVTTDTVKITASGNASQITIYDNLFLQSFTGNVNNDSILSVSGSSPAVVSQNSAEVWTGKGVKSGNNLSLIVYGFYTSTAGGYTYPYYDTLTFTGTRH